jgi:predicted small secreted protein
MTPRMPVVCLAVLASAFTVAACGGDDGPGPDAAVRSYYRALLEGDGTRACAGLTDALSREIAATDGAKRAGGTCPDVLALASGLNPDRAGDDLNGLRVDVDRDGDVASARLSNPLTNKPETLRVERVDGEWRIASLELRPQR